MSRLVWDMGRADPRGSERLGEREGGVKVELKPRTGRTEGLRLGIRVGGDSGLSRLSGANPDARRPFPGPLWDVKDLKNPPPTSTGPSLSLS